MSYDNQTASPQGKIAQGTEGLGTASLETVEERAREIALADGRRDVNEKDLAEAREGLVPGGLEPLAPELDSPETGNVTSWDTAPEDSGSHVAAILPDDEASIAEQLVQEGLDEADHASRTTAGQENPPEEE